MDTLLQQYEYPLPKLVVSGDTVINDKLIIESTRQGITGQFFMKNNGGQMLEGTLTSTKSLLRLDAESFSSNHTSMGYAVLENTLPIGETEHAKIIISSNGGEMVVPVIIKIVPRSLSLEDAEIKSLKDFAAYARKQPQTAATIFINDSFANWLAELDAEHCHIDIYEQLRKTPNPRLSLETFLVIHKLKNPVTLSIVGGVTAEQEYNIIENSTTPIHGLITIRRSQWGYFEQDLRIKYGSDWLCLQKQSISSDDFASGDSASLSFTIDPTKIKTSHVSDKIVIGNLEISIKVKASPSFVFYLPKAYFKAGAHGRLIVHNLSGASATLDLIASESFIRLDTKTAELPHGETELSFTAKLSPIQSAQMLIKKQPTVTGEIQARITQNKRVLTKSLSVTIGEIDQ